MKTNVIASVAIALTSPLAFSQAPQPVPTAPPNPGFASSLVPKPSDYSGKLFSANYSFPTSAQDMTGQPWLTIDPRTESDRQKYYDAILTYALTSFQGDLRSGCPAVSPAWFHVPWMTFGFGASPADIAAGRTGPGREPICGLTQERSAPIGFLYKDQKTTFQTWAVGMFNNPGGYLLSRIWRNHDAVDLTETTFPNGGFIAKFLFTEATEADVPYLKGSPTWQANIYEKDGDPARVRKTKPMRLAQIDFGVRDKRMDGQSGWVYGTFLYVNTTPAIPIDWTKNLVPVGLMWGNDHGVKDPTKYKEQALNPAVKTLRDAGQLFDLSKRKTFGWFDRVNGPIDNPVSSCLSCHATAQVSKNGKPIKQFITPALVPGQATDDNKMLWFRTIKAGQTFTFTQDQLKLLSQGAPNTIRADWTLPLMAQFVSTDYSLQLRMAIENAWAYDAEVSAATLEKFSPAFAASPVLQKMKIDMARESKRIERDGRQP